MSETIRPLTDEQHGAYITLAGRVLDDELTRTETVLKKYSELAEFIKPGKTPRSHVVNGRGNFTFTPFSAGSVYIKSPNVGIANQQPISFSGVIDATLAAAFSVPLSGVLPDIQELISETFVLKVNISNTGTWVALSYNGYPVGSLQGPGQLVLPITDAPGTGRFTWG